jgi:hypothetical protein
MHLVFPPAGLTTEDTVDEAAEPGLLPRTKLGVEEEHMIENDNDEN